MTPNATRPHAPAPHLAPRTRFSPPLGRLAGTVLPARRAHRELTLSPLVRPAHPPPGEGRGTLAPSHPDRWFRAYRDLLGDLAAVAAQALRMAKSEGCGPRDYSAIISYFEHLAHTSLVPEKEAAH